MFVLPAAPQATFRPEFRRNSGLSHLWHSCREENFIPTQPCEGGNARQLHNLKSKKPVYITCRGFTFVCETLRVMACNSEILPGN